MRRALVFIVGAVIVVGGLGALLLAFQARDDAGIDTAQTAQGPGQEEPDRGREHVADAEDALSPEPPTSGPHKEELPVREGAWTDGQILHALELGNIVFVHDGTPPPELVALQEAVSGPFEPQLVEAGQMVVLVRRSGVDDVQGLAWRRRVRATSPGDTVLREFAETWLGSGAGR